VEDQKAGVQGSRDPMAGFGGQGLGCRVSWEGGVREKKSKPFGTSNKDY
jgi:hypothetical protein